jgi:putative DNA-invertase from lambdoid prophage Rac
MRHRKNMSSKYFRAALYARVSTADQQTIPLQIGAMQDYTQRRGWKVVAEVQDINGGAKLRPKREELLKLARQRKLDVIIVWRLDRWGRSLHDVLQSLQELHELGVDFVSVTEGLDFTTSTGRAMAGMLAIFAQFEREILRERVLAGLAHARSKGKVLGPPRTARNKADQIQQLLADGFSKTQIARKLKIGRASVYRALERSQT